MDTLSLITQALNNAFEKLEKQVPQTKKKIENIKIEDIKPSQLSSFIAENDIPDDCCFDLDKYGNQLLSWEVEVPTTDIDKLEFKNNRFNNIAFKSVYDLLTANGYGRISKIDRNRTGSRKLNYVSYITTFDGMTIYEMYIGKNFDLLLEYYSMYFRKIEG